MSLVLSNKGKGMQSSSEQPLVGEERYVTTRITAGEGDYFRSCQSVINTRGRTNVYFEVNVFLDAIGVVAKVVYK